MSKFSVQACDLGRKYAARGAWLPVPYVGFS